MHYTIFKYFDFQSLTPPLPPLLLLEKGVPHTRRGEGITSVQANLVLPIIVQPPTCPLPNGGRD